MKMRMLFVLFMLSVFLVAGTAVAGIDLNPGKWEFTTRTEMQGMAGMNIPPQTHTQCITSDNVVPKSQGTSQECQMTDIVINGDSVSWKIVCDGMGGRMEGNGKAIYHGDSMEGTMEMVIADSNMKIVSHITGRRIGDCDGQSTTSSTQTYPMTKVEASEAEGTVIEDVKDVGQAAQDEVKDSATEEARKGVRRFLNKIFD